MYFYHLLIFNYSLHIHILFLKLIIAFFYIPNISSNLNYHLQFLLLGILFNFSLFLFTQLIVTSLFVTFCYAAKLDNTYLPPPSAGSAGGGPGLAAPFGPKPGFGKFHIVF